MYTKQELENFTVLQLRKIAKENKVKLRAGIDKAGIVQKICLDCGIPFEGNVTPLKDSLPEPVQTKGTPKSEQLSLMDSSLSFDVTSAPKKRTTAKGAQEKTAGLPPINIKPEAKPVVQSREVRSSPLPMAKSPVRPIQPLGGQKRFGPRSHTPEVQKEKSEVSPASAPSNPSQLVTTDGYRLGYRAQSTRNGYQNRNDYGAPDSRPHASYSKYPVSIPEADHHFHDNIYQMARNVEFDQQVQNGELPNLLRCAEGENVKGKLELTTEGYGFLRNESVDIYVSPAQIKRYGLRSNDEVEGKALLVKQGDPYPALLYIDKLNGKNVQSDDAKTTFEQMDAIYPSKKIPMDVISANDSFSRMMDLLAPIGYGQRGIIVAPPESGKLTVIQDIALAIHKNDPDAEIFILLIDVPPEEITEMKKTVQAEVFAASFADAPETQTRVSEALLERAQRSAADGKNAVILLDSLNKLVRAYQNQVAQGNRPITNAVTPSALIRPKHLLGMAKNTKDAGSLTVIAILQVETASRIDDIIFEEFKDTANMMLYLKKKAENQPMFPMIDVARSGTRREDMMLSEKEKEGLKLVHTLLMDETNENAIAQLVDMMNKTRTNKELLTKLPGWLAILENQ